MLAGFPPFQSKTQEEIYKKVKNLHYVWPKDIECSNFIPAEAKDLVSSCLSLDEEQRPSPDDIVDHQFFNMYPGCIPRSLDPSWKQTKPVWLKMEEPRGDRMIQGYSLDFEEKYRSKAPHTRDARERYAFCKEAFYTECGVGRKRDGTSRKCAGKHSSKSVYSETAAETEKMLSPTIPLPLDFVYRYPVYFDGDWSTPESEYPVTDESNDSSKSSDDSYETMPGAEAAGKASLTRTKAALAAAQVRRFDSQPQSHAATLRQQALPVRQSSRSAATVSRPPNNPTHTRKGTADSLEGLPESPQKSLGQRPVRGAPRGAPSYSASIRELDRLVAPPMPKSESMPNSLGMAKTRSQSRRQLEVPHHQRPPLPPGMSEGIARTATPVDELRPGSSTTRTVRLPSRPQLGRPAERDPRAMQQPPAADSARDERHKASKTGTSNKPRSTLGTNPLIHHSEQFELLYRSSPEEVVMDIKAMLRNMMPSASRTYRSQNRRRPHSYVIKWVDYTNRYGIGYILDDGTVGCVFKGEHGQPASGVILRDGERHIRRKARCQENRDAAPYAYSEVDQLVPRNGRPVEFYENSDRGPAESRGMKKVLVQPDVFEVKTSSSGSGAMGVKVRTDSGVDYAKSEAEKVKRVKLVDQFGKYMIGSLGRSGDADVMSDDGPSTRESDVCIKFYQRLGNVGVWGFGDGAFQVALNHLFIFLCGLANIFSVQLSGSHQAGDFSRAEQRVIAMGRLLPSFSICSTVFGSKGKNAPSRV